MVPHHSPATVDANTREKVYNSGCQHEDMPDLVAVKPNIEVPRVQSLRKAQNVDDQSSAVKEKHEGEATEEGDRCSVQRDDYHEVNRGKCTTRCHPNKQHDTVDEELWLVEEVEEGANKAGTSKREDHRQVHDSPGWMACESVVQRWDEASHDQTSDAEVVHQDHAVEDFLTVVGAEQVVG